MSDTNGQTFYDVVIKKLNHQVNDLQRKYDDSLIKIKDLQLRLAKYEPEVKDEQNEQDFTKLK